MDSAVGSDRTLGALLDPPPPSTSTCPDTVSPQRTNKRPLKDSKRAEQNRKAQQAFRQRKEERIHQLECKAVVLEQTQRHLALLTRENRVLRDYIVSKAKRNNEPVPDLDELITKAPVAIQLPPLSSLYCENSFLGFTDYKRDHSQPGSSVS
ncbi:putative transcription factor kapC [Neolecta irregularis DAH-3]|uniref:Putative transcription factor kapC n=1 Tax=Neolecta irregularis (strain DAH-3) TaxID=1198029 RepID=A0A1U7LSJ9_NEOID|nr:putative transcription factor kapC [Neolecta irregularis DAH-3]|eukprot:OLL25637.1 putative transcription factor kapC [Neolecta irregularis DAH-3]